MKKQDLIYSEPVREIMGNPPGFLLKWGTAIILALFILFLLLAWKIRYPDRIPSPVEITTENPPAILVSKTSGIIKHLFPPDNSVVHPGQVLAMMESAASISDINRLRHLIDTIDQEALSDPLILPDLDTLGEMQQFYSEFRKCASEYSAFVRNDYYGNMISSARDELEGIRHYAAQLRVNEKILDENLRIEMNRFRRDSLLNTGAFVAQSEYEKSKKELNNQKLALQEIRLDLSQKKLEEINKQKQIMEFGIRESEERERLAVALDEAFNSLRAQFRIWEMKYLFVSGIEGTVTFTSVWSENQAVEEGEPVLSIVPLEPGKYIGRVMLGMRRSGIVDSGKTVYIKLSSFPYLEYGMLQGIIRSKSLVAEEDAYVITIDLPDGLTTMYGKRLPFTQNMKGTAEIITDDRSLLSRILSPFRFLWSVNR